MKKFSFKAVALAAGLVVGGSAFAAASSQNLDAKAADATPASYAAEQNVSSSGVTIKAGVVAKLDADVKLGASFGTNGVAYVRFDLSTGTFKGNPSFAIAGTTGAGAAGAAAVVSVSQGGDGASYVIFSVTPAATEHLEAATVGVYAPNATGYTVKDQSAVTLQYRLFETLTAAANPAATNTLKTASNVHAKFASAYSVKFTPKTVTADVGATTGSYTDFTTAGTQLLADIAIAVDTAVALQDGTAVSAGAILDDKTTVAVTGDFTFTKGKDDTSYTKSRVFLSATDCATNAPVNATSLNGTTASFGDATVPSITAANLVSYKALCVKPSTTTEIQAGNYSADLTYVVQSGYTLANTTGKAAGTIVRNGATLVAPLVNQPTGWYSRLVLTNAGSTARTYSVKAVSETGTTVTLSGAAASGTLAANSTTVIDLPATATITGGAPRTALVVTVNGPTSVITGQYQIVEPTGQSISNYTLVQK